MLLALLLIFAELNTPCAPIKSMKIHIIVNTILSFFFTPKLLKNFILLLPFFENLNSKNPMTNNPLT
ncbi:hypothetical protein SDC9_145512 [bioreactor metagenome]|uniref:Uncharacterized protein n=1 Tax=bioreactor metagenome TaxID=1076179 RepID=A0A645E8V4_9ZZZZ